MLAKPLTGFLTGKLGCRAVILMAGLGLCIDLPLLALMDSLGGMAAALLLFGAAIGMIDVAMNVQAVIVERASGKAMMSGFHGFFSIGGIAGAAMGRLVKPFAAVAIKQTTANVFKYAR